MSVHIVRLGSPRLPDEGMRIGTVRRPPRGVRKADYAALDFYDVWLPNLSPSPALFHAWREAQDERDIATFQRKFRAEMKAPDVSRVLDLLAALSHQTSFSVGCYCEDESRCHRTVLRQLLEERGARVE
ncbi:MAG: hypothetical protein JWR22_928 [Herminiimonas sp.]|nr:hypothetical protein [Herminiimonas sp.]